MKITLVCSDPQHPIRASLFALMERYPIGDICLVEKVADAYGGDFLFLISCHELVRIEVRDLYRHVLVIHASDLPKDRGWSPHIWALIRGDVSITVSLLEAEDAVDSGRIWKKLRIPLTGNEIVTELNYLLFAAEIELIEWALKNFNDVQPEVQDNSAATYLRRRTLEDSRVDPSRTIAEQFDLMRVCDPHRYPAFFEFRGRKFKLEITPMKPTEN